MQFDVCNGDADGLCAVVQWRLHAPCEARLVTGLKRDIGLLARVQAGAGDNVLVCDVSMRRNADDLARLLQAGARVQYFDHHAVDAIPAHSLLEAHIDTASDQCTSLLVDRQLGGKFRAWALVGAYGDNLTEQADQLARDMGLGPTERQRLRQLGEAINYNAYGDTLQDVYMAPAPLFDVLVRFADPLALLERDGIGQALDALRRVDMQQAHAMTPYHQNAHTSVYVLPDVPWSRRVVGTWVNALASDDPQRAHAVLRARALGDYVVSVRAPLAAPTGAVEFCRPFGGDGRAGAAGIDHLPGNRFKDFLEAFAAAPWAEQPTTEPAP